MIKDDNAYIEHINLCINKINMYIDGITKQEFLKNELIQDAVIRNIEIIGEATKSLSNEYKKKNDNIQWKEMAGMRDKLIHHYMGVDIEVVWETINIDLKELQKMLE